MAHSIERVHVTIDGVTHALAPLENADDLRRQILSAVYAQGGFLTVTTDDGRKMSILVTPATSATIAVETVHLSSPSAEPQRVDRPTPRTHDEDDMPFDLI